MNPSERRPTGPAPQEPASPPTMVQVAPQPTLINATGEPTVINATGEPTLINATGEPTVINATAEPTLISAAGEPTLVHADVHPPTVVQRPVGSTEVIPGRDPTRSYSAGELAEPPPLRRRRRTWAVPVPAWLTTLGPPLVVYALTRVVLLATAFFDGRIRRGGITELLSRWNAGLYLDLARRGYPTHPDIHSYYPLGLFPGFPGLIRATTTLTGLSTPWAGALDSVACGAVFVILGTLLARRLWGSERGAGAGLLLAAFPGGFVLGLPFETALALAASAGCLLLLVQRRWVLGGLAAAVATLTSPVTLPLVAACACGVLYAGRRARALLGALLATGGALTYFFYLWLHAGNFFAWYDMERYWFHQRLGNGLLHAIEHSRQDVLLTGVSLLLGVAGLACLLSLRPFLPVIVYSVGVWGALAFDGALGPTPTFLLSAFTLVLALGARLRGRALELVLGCSVFLLPVVMVLYISLGNHLGQP